MKLYAFIVTLALVVLGGVTIGQRAALEASEDTVKKLRLELDEADERLDFAQSISDIYKAAKEDLGDLVVNMRTHCLCPDASGEIPGVQEALQKPGRRIDVPTVTQ